MRDSYIGRSMACHVGAVRLGTVWSAGFDELLHLESISAIFGHIVQGIRARVAASNDLFSAHDGV
jgi:hypothetical protein